MGSGWEVVLTTAKKYPKEKKSKETNNTMELHKFNTGAIIKTDPRNFKVKEVEEYLPQAPTIPPVYIPDLSKFPIFYQGKIGSCVGHAGAWLKMYLDYLDTKEIKETSPRFLYALAKKEDGIPKLDGNGVEIEGTNPVMAGKILQKYGVATAKSYPNNVNMTHAKYIDTTGITPAIYEEAEEAKISAYAEITDKSFNNLKKEIFRNGAILLCVNHGGEYYTLPNGKISWGLDLFPMKKLFPIVSGHETVAIGYDENNIYYVNSFGDDWGRRGIGWFASDYVERIKESHLVVDLPNSVIIELREKRKTIMYAIISKLQQLLALLKK